MRIVYLAVILVFASSFLQAQIPVVKAFPTQAFISGTSNHNSFSAYKHSQKNASGQNLITSDSLSPFKRYLYTQVVTLPPMVTAHFYLLAIALPPDEWHKKFKISRVKRAFTEPPVFDHDSWFFNYGVHGYMGQMGYLAYRNRGGKAWQAYAVTAINTITYEYIVASSTQQPSINDILVTPVLGLFLGEASYQFVKHLRHGKKISFVEKMLILAIDPVETTRNGFDFKKMAAKPF